MMFRVSDIVEANGKTIKENNMLKTHAIPVGALVEVKHQEWHGGGACSKIQARLFVVYCGRDCDGTPLYWLSKIRRDQWDTVTLTTGDWKFNAEISQKIYYGVIGGFSESSLIVIKVTPEVEAGEGSLRWEE